MQCSENIPRGPLKKGAVSSIPDLIWARVTWGDWHHTRILLVARHENLFPVPTGATTHTKTWQHGGSQSMMTGRTEAKWFTVEDNWPHSPVQVHMPGCRTACG